MKQYQRPSTIKQHYLEWARSLVTHPEEIKKVRLHWDQMSNWKWEPQQITKVISFVAWGLDQHKDHPKLKNDVAAAKKHVQDNIEVWTKIAYPLVPQMDGKQFDYILQAFERLGVNVEPKFLQRMAATEIADVKEKYNTKGLEARIKGPSDTSKLAMRPSRKRTPRKQPNKIRHG